MNKINFLRKRLAEQYHAADLESAARTGEALLREHWNNRSMMTLNYANDIYNLARVYDAMGHLERAVELYTDGAHLFSRLPEGNSTAYVGCLNNLAAALHGLGMEENASHLFGQLVSVRRYFGNDDDVEFADSLYNLANAVADIGIGRNFHSQAFKWHTEALRIRKQEGNTEDIIDSLHSLAFLHEEKGEYGKAVPLAEMAMEMAQGDDYICSCYYLAGLYHTLGEYEKALPLYEEAALLTRERMGRTHHCYMEVSAKQAQVLDKIGRTREALAINEELRVLLEGVAGFNTLMYGKCLHHMAELHKQLGEYEQAEELLLRSLKINRKRGKDATEDICLLIRLYLLHDKEKALEMLVYALMHSDANGPGLAELLNKMAEAFNYSEGPGVEAILNALHQMNDRTLLQPIIQKWKRWDSDPFIPAFTTSSAKPPPVDRDRT